LNGTIKNLAAVFWMVFQKSTLSSLGTDFLWDMPFVLSAENGWHKYCSLWAVELINYIFLKMKGRDSYD